jgi:putative acetyltransferase
MERHIVIRPIESADNPAIAAIIRSTLKEFDVAGPGTAYFDTALDDMYTSFQTAGSRYFVGIVDDTIVGGGGIFPTAGLPKATCELTKMYLIPAARGLGLARRLIDHCFEFAHHAGYNQVYLETMPELEKAVSIYERYGFQRLEGPMGDTGHYSCSVWMLLNLQQLHR